MNTLSSKEKTGERCLLEAVAWRTRLTENDLTSTPEFEIWLAADARHQAAWDRVQDPWNFIGEQQTSPELLELRRTALTDAREAARQRWTTPTEYATQQRCEFTTARASTQSIPEPTVRSTRQVRFLAAAALAVLFVAGLLIWNFYSPDVYRTQTGERRVVTLSDGSQIQLDSSTELRVRYSAHARDLRLSRGQARFDVAHDVERPFAVTAGGHKVVATGTAFNVDLLGANLLVTLIEGHVVVLPGRESGDRHPSRRERTGATGEVLQAAPASNEGESSTRAPRRGNRSGRGIELDAGEQLVVSASGRSNVVPANIERTTAWQSGQLVFDNEPLASIIERVNRYSQQPLVLTDERAAELRISGVFNSADIEGFVDALTRYLPVDADKRDGSIRLSHR